MVRTDTLFAIIGLVAVTMAIICVVTDKYEYAFGFSIMASIFSVSASIIKEIKDKEW